jgi:peroxiredoxin
LKFFGDHDGSWTRALGMEVDLSGALLGMRSQRYSLYIDNGLIIKVVRPPLPVFNTIKSNA